MRDAPPFLFCLAKREMGRARSKEKSVGALRCSGPPRGGGRRIGASADLARPSGTLFSSAGAILPSRGGWCRGQRGARAHLTSFSFRAFRFATRYLGDCRGLYYRVDEGVFPCNGGDGFRHPRRGRCPHRPVAEAFINHRLAAAKICAACIPNFPGLEGSPRAGRFRP